MGQHQPPRYPSRPSRQWDNPRVDLASRLRACERNWRLNAGGRLDGGFRSEVFGYTTADGEEVVVKLVATAEDTRAETAALRAWSHTGAAVRLIDADFGHRALLLERIRPATHLPAGDDPAVIEAAADVLGRLHRSPPETFRGPALEEIYVRMERRSRQDAAYEQRARGEPARGTAGLERLGLSRAAVTRLCATTQHAVLLHGDFLDKNLLWNGARYLAIDPIPGVGDPCSDVGFFAAGHPPATTIRHRADAMAGHLGLDRERAQQWAAVWTVLQACQAWRQDQAELAACLSGREFEDLLRAKRVRPDPRARRSRRNGARR
jgi:streptomycin 6-kinase